MNSKAAVFPELDFDTSWEGACGAAKTFLLESGECPTILHIGLPGQTLLLNPIWANQYDKLSSRNRIVAALYHQCNWYILVAESWRLTVPITNDIPVPSESPDRIECVIVSGQDIKLGPRIAIYDIIRHGDSIDLIKYDMSDSHCEQDAWQELLRRESSDA